MATKWAVNLAVRKSGMPSSQRLIMLVLSDVADSETGVIPDDRTPCLRELAEWTGLDKSTVTRNLDALDDNGWVIRDRPDRDTARRELVRTKYRLDVPRGAHDTTEEAEAVVHNATRRGAQDDTIRGAQDTTAVVHDAPTSVVHSAPVPYTDKLKNNKTPSSSAKGPKAKPDPPTERPDVEKICNHLVDRIVANGCRRPTITAKWRTEARLLLDKDGKTPDQVIRCIDWATSDQFWKANILSMPTLRAKYDQLSLAAQRQRTYGRASPARRLVEHDGLMLKPETVEQLERSERFEAMDKQQAKQAIEGPR